MNRRTSSICARLSGEHVRKLASSMVLMATRYDKRHMAQEDHLKETKTKEELENTKSTIRYEFAAVRHQQLELKISYYSLRNWGHVSQHAVDARTTTVKP